MADVQLAGQRFLRALEEYIRHRLNDDKNFDADGYVKVYGDFLEALGVQANQPLFEALMDHMRQMKDAGRVSRVDLESRPPI